MKELKILVNTPNLNANGGVANHFLGLKGKFRHNVKYNYIGGQSKSKLFLLKQLKDLFIFAKQIIKFNPDIIHLNPSLNKKAVIRDALFLIIAKILAKKILIFWHGWENDFAELITKKHIKSFQTIYNLADGFWVLAEDFRKQLLSWQIRKPIYLETTKIDDDLLHNFEINNKIYNSQVLFLARVEANKGIFIILDAIKGDKKINLIVAGNGGALEKSQKKAEDEKIKNVNFLGYISGNEKINAFKNASLYILPTWHGEGMPTSILEAMAFGLPIITRPVGGLKDFFENGKMGYITESKDPKVFADLIEKLIKDKEKMKKIGKYNHEYAKKRFLASKVAKRLEAIYEKTYYGK